MLLDLTGDLTRLLLRRSSRLLRLLLDLLCPLGGWGGALLRFVLDLLAGLLVRLRRRLRLCDDGDRLRDTAN
jgi:hypothetical protein